MEWLDGVATSIGGSTCRFFNSNGHEALVGIFCSDGYYSAGWRVFAAIIILAIMGFVFFNFLRPNR